MEKWVEVCRFSQKMGGSGVFFLKKGLEWVVIFKITVGVCHFCQKMGGSGLFFLKNRWEWVTFLENLWEWVVFIEKWVGVGCFY